MRRKHTPQPNYTINLNSYGTAIQMKNPRKNPNCDKDKCIAVSGEVRLLPTGGGGNIIVCFACYKHELEYRAEYGGPSPLWSDLKVYQMDEREM